MDVSFLYHGFGLRTVECSRTEYKDNGIVLNVQTRSEKFGSSQEWRDTGIV